MNAFTKQFHPEKQLLRTRKKRQRIDGKATSPEIGSIKRQSEVHKRKISKKAKHKRKTGLFGGIGEKKKGAFDGGGSSLLSFQSVSKKES